MALSQTEIMMYASAAGFPNPALMAAIALAESSGNPSAVNSIGCVGLWQINQPVWVHTYPSWSQSWLKDPMHNAQAAKVVYDAQGLQAWETYTSGAYERFYTAGSAADASWLGDQWNTFTQGFSNGWNFNFGEEKKDLGQQWDNSPAGSTVNALGGLDTIANRFGAAGSWAANPHNWVRVAWVTLGGLVVLVGLAGILRPVIQPAAQAAVSAVAPVGKIVKAVKAVKK